MWVRLLLIEALEGYSPPSERTEAEKDRALRELIGFARRNGRQMPTAAVAALVQLAVENPRTFCTQLLAACLPAPSNRRRTVYPQPTEARIGAGLPHSSPGGKE
jgi:hypothetical protein